MRYQQPRGPVTIDRGNPLTHDLVFATEASFGGRDAVAGLQSSPLLSGVTVGAGPKGTQWNYSGAQGNRANAFGNWQGLAGATEATWDMTVYFSGLQTSVFFDQWDLNNQWLLQNVSGVMIWVMADDNAGSRRRRDSVANVIGNQGWYRITAIWRGGASAELLINNVSVPLVASNDAATSIGTNGGDHLQIGNTLNGAVAGARIWRRGLTPAEAWAVHRNPLQLYAPLQRSLWVAGEVVPGGPLVVNESGSDSAILSGVVAVQGALTATESSGDSASCTGASAVAGSLSVLELGSDSAVLLAGSGVQGALSANEVGSDSAAAAGANLVQGNLARTESGADTLVASGTAAVSSASGAMAVSESGSDTAVVSGSAPSPGSGSLAVSESGSDTAVVSGSAPSPGSGSLAVSEAGSDSAVLGGSVAVQGGMNVLEIGSTTIVMTGAVSVQGTLSVLESGSDVFSGSSTLVASVGAMAASESGSDTAAMVASVWVYGSLSVLELGADRCVAYGPITNAPVSLYVATVPLARNQAAVPLPFYQAFVQQ
jgi:hypothetical protein